ncbi:MAG: hypothetical protein GQ581_04560 [Methyloprofundus sp.]|nr:hypothetical protein [Methyloprofundus sp.]
MLKTLLAIVSLIPAISMADDVYDFNSGVLHIPKLIVGTESYTVNLLHKGELVFEVVSANLIASATTLDIITLEPDGFSLNSSIADSNVTLSVLSSDSLSRVVFAVEQSSKATTGTQVFGYNDDAFGGQWFNPERVLRIDFSSPTNFVAIDVHGFDSFDVGHMAIYDKANVLLDTLISAPLESGHEFETLTTGQRPSADIAYALVFGPNSTDTVAIDNLQFAPPVDTLDLKSEVLHLPVVVVGTERYVVDMQHQGDLVFAISSASPIINVPDFYGKWVAQDISLELTILADGTLLESNPDGSLFSGTFAGTWEIVSVEEIKLLFFNGTQEGFLRLNSAGKGSYTANIATEQIHVVDKE